MPRLPALAAALATPRAAAAPAQELLAGALNEGELLTTGACARRP